ncbi:hypothetical protein ACFQX6_20475 [Streptosporangium lutulentum]
MISAPIAIRRNTTALGGSWENRSLANPAPTCTDRMASSTSPDGGIASAAARSSAPDLGSPGSYGSAGPSGA